MQGTEYDPIFSDEELAVLALYVSDPNSDIFVLLPSLYGLGGALFARYSRAPGGARVRLLKEFLDENGKLKSEKLQELIAKILIAYGDESVGELEGSSLAVENTSNLGTKEIEDNRLLAFIEQSSRYVIYDQKDRNGKYRYLRPQEAIQAGLLGKYEKIMDRIFGIYVSLVEPMSEYFRKLKPENEAVYAIKFGDEKKYQLADLTDEKEIKAWRLTYRTDIKTKACDTIRGLLPAATLTNLGIVGGGRAYQNMLTKLFSHQLKEMRKTGQKAKEALSVVIPNYVKRAEISDYLQTVNREMEALAKKLLWNLKPSKVTESVDLFSAGSWRIRPMAIAHILYPYSNLSLRDLYNFAETLLPDDCEKIVATYCQHKDVRGNRRNKPGRGLEFGYPITFDLVGDFGIYRDLQRHRMLTQQRQLLTPYLGYSIPEEVIDAGLAWKFKACISYSEELYELLLKNCGPVVAQYAVLFLFNIRWYMGMNYREAFHLMELRTIPQGHPSYRKLTQQMHTKLMNDDPLIPSLMEFVDYNNYFWSRAESESAQRRKEEKT